MGNSPKTCFVIGPIGDDGSEIRKDADDFYELVLVETLKAAGFENPVRADRVAKAGEITKDIADRLLTSDVVIADLRIPNPNVYYELSYRNARRRAVIPFKRVGQDLPFDIKNSRTISVDVKDARSVNTARGQLKSYLFNLAEPGAAESVWSISEDILKLEKGSPMDRAIARILETTELLPAIYEHATVGDNVVVSKTARTMWQRAEAILEQFIDDPLWSHDAYTEKCLEHVRELQRFLLDFAQAPYVSEDVPYY